MLLFRFAAALLLLLGLAAPGAAQNWPPKAADLSLTVTRANSGCLEGADCRLAIQIENLGTAPFKGGLSIVIETAAPSVPGFAGAGKWSCQRIAYGRHACALPPVDLAPGIAVTDLASIRFLPTPMGEAEVCANIDWDGVENSPARDAALSVIAALGKKRPASGDAGELLQAVFGTWGEADLRDGNDRGCAAIAIGRPETVAACAEGEERIAGSCTALDAFCSGKRKRGAVGSCECPAAGQAFDPVSRGCTAAAPANCDGGRTANGGLCFCPEARPLWNAEKGACEEWGKPAPAPVTAEVEEPAPPAPPPKVVAPVKTVEPPVKRRIVHRPTCGRDEVRRGNACVKVAQRTVKKAKPIRLAQRIPARQAPARRYKVNRCPLVFAVCIIKVLRQRRLEREARGL